MLDWLRAFTSAFLGRLHRTKGHKAMQTDTNREGHIFRLIAGTVMVLAILFGVLELFNVVHI
ncbi:MAG: hypothetical protein QOF91_1566 [Alphaproteobacteria bacterium]|nr:hypothetical protein [Alphaproteobacteria bacterium]MEA3026281.1 hypothetical protein [Alphaproteobacteria bacterium]